MSDTPALADNERCARCGEGFHCGANDPTPCPCSTLTLSPALLERLRDQYRGCLCLRCLQHLAATDGEAARYV